MYFYMPTRLFAGAHCVRNNGQWIAALGRRAFVVTGASSAKASGALDDLLAVFSAHDIVYALFNKVEQNPTLATCHQAGRQAADFRADFIVGVGGGSPLDAAKAVAAIATRPTRPSMELFDHVPSPSLPIVAIPTTAGTGSESNAHAVITIDKGLRKKTFKVDYNFPELSFLDARYLTSLPNRVAVCTALDALCHCVESALSPADNPIVLSIALHAAAEIWRLLPKLAQGDATLAHTQTLLEAACMGGMAIQHNGTGFPHPLGYNLTLQHGLPHGAACAVFLPAFVQAVYAQAPQRVDRVLSAMGCTLDEMAQVIRPLHGFADALTTAQTDKYVKLLSNQAFRTIIPTETQIRALYAQLPALPQWPA